MAGIGEASAILAVAHIGIGLSQTIVEFIGEAKDASSDIRRIAREICTTSERLEEIGRLIDKNSINHLFSTGGISSAIRCSRDCEEIIAQVSGVLAKGGWIPGSTALDAKDIDISLFQSVRWPFLKAKLAGPQADLEKVKASLSLLFNSAMANLYIFSWRAPEQLLINLDHQIRFTHHML